ncbi:MAG: hypothetical protein Alis3KO_36220 [Aliiglaciecola sp.]|uniref:lactoylglutathione lyase n=1 Tax=Aliiglaciecola sp. M165 TaxID=2593649 RepID=UPI00117E236B|nr:lactoylglutathione lyase [Aliiglaciecola sp. M165]TRY33453.1 lactoylglutathione lyase [Aliiglaciecola sp. M165]
MKVEDIRVFVPCKNYDESKAFYSDLGFSQAPATDDLTLVENGDCTFFLQRFYNKDFAENLMLQVCVADIDHAYELAKATKYAQKLTPIESERWGKVFYLWGPSGELLHVTQLSN